MNEGAGQVEICVVVFEPNGTVPIPDVVLDMKTFYFGDASKFDCFIDTMYRREVE